mmetsp:Transcript_42184/g.119715  ORF Transcript_42184/g.119715 Transcript_42184/m.119715 type:complete len:110 (+) Transcript_42184:727-1056(+)
MHDVWMDRLMDRLVRYATQTWMCMCVYVCVCVCVWAGCVQQAANPHVSISPERDEGRTAQHSTAQRSAAQQSPPLCAAHSYIPLSSMPCHAMQQSLFSSKHPNLPQAQT